MAFRELGIGQLWMDGELIDWDDAQIHVMSHVVNYGSCAIEGIRCYETDQGPAIFRFDDHFDRLRESARFLGIEIEYTGSELKRATKRLVRANDLSDCYIRPAVFHGYHAPGLTAFDECPTHTVLAAWPKAAHAADSDARAVDVHVSSWRKIHSSQIPSTAKIGGCYVSALITYNEAHSSGYDNAIVLNTDGNVAEGPLASLFLVRNGRLYTPGIESSILDGITRRTIIEFADELGITVREKTITTGELYASDEAFFAGTTAEITPIRQINGFRLNEGPPGPVTQRVHRRYSDVVHGRSEEHRDWLDFVLPS